MVPQRDLRKKNNKTLSNEVSLCLNCGCIGCPYTGETVPGIYGGRPVIRCSNYLQASIGIEALAKLAHLGYFQLRARISRWDRSDESLERYLFGLTGIKVQVIRDDYGKRRFYLRKRFNKENL